MIEKDIFFDGLLSNLYDGVVTISFSISVYLTSFASVFSVRNSLYNF